MSYSSSPADTVRYMMKFRSNPRTFECHTVDGMGEIMSVAVISEVWNQFVVTPTTDLEGSAGGEVEVTNNLVHSHPTCNVTTFICLLPKLVRPSFLFALAKTIDNYKTLGRDMRTWSMASGSAKLQPRLTYAILTSSPVLQHPLSGSKPP